VTATPTTTKLGPDQARIRALMRRLADTTSVDAPIITLTIDLRPQAHGERPGERPEIAVVRDRLRTIEDELEPHTPAHDSFVADRDRIDEFLRGDATNRGVAFCIFACAHIGLWETLEVNDDLETHVSTGPTADLFALARALEDVVSAVVAIVDSNTCRLFVTRRGSLRELDGPDEPPDEHRRRDVGGWSQARYQRHIDMQDRRFAREAADALLRLVQRERPRHVVLAGDERALPLLEAELAEEVRPLVEHTTAIELRATTDEVHEAVAPILGALREHAARSVADRAVAGARAGDLGVVGMDATARALDLGQVDELVIDEAAPVDEELRAELVRQAAATDARVELVRDHDVLQRHDGIGATLRFRISDRDS
jgi:peptide chain release factor subunit 1